jgi:hypothetical protein
MGDNIVKMIVCLRDGKEAVEQLNLKAIYPELEEAKNVALDIRIKLCASELALQHASSQRPASASETGCCPSRWVFFGLSFLG